MSSSKRVYLCPCNTTAETAGYKQMTSHGIYSVVLKKRMTLKFEREA